MTDTNKFNTSNFEQMLGRLKRIRKSADSKFYPPYTVHESKVLIGWNEVHDSKGHVILFGQMDKAEAQKIADIFNKLSKDHD